MVFRAIPKYKGLHLQPTKCTNGTFFFGDNNWLLHFLNVHSSKERSYYTHTHTHRKLENVHWWFESQYEN